MNIEDIRPGTIFEWPHSFSVWSRWVIDRLDGHGNHYAWIHHEESGTINRLSVDAIRMHGRLVALPSELEEEDISESELWWGLAFIVVLTLAVFLYFGKN